MAYVIKRYSNRKLYDTQESRYVTLEEIEEMIRAGREISVVDATSGEDLTSVTLTQIILENERNRRANLPSAFLHQLIKHGEAWQDFVQRTMRSSLEGFVSSQRDMERVFREWSSRSGWGPVAGTPAAAADAKREADAKRDSSEGKRDGAADTEADKLRDEVSALRDRLRSLEERLQKRKADAK
jgi:polyhydroxyalkanoate synthesis repressor PhaR